MRWVLYSIGFILLLAVVMLVAINVMPTQWLSERAEAFATEFLGMPVEIGKIDFTLLSATPTFSVSDVSLKSSDQLNILSGAAIDISLIGADLLTGEVTYRSVTIANADLNLIVDQNGERNWQTLVQQFSPSETTDKSTASNLPSIQAIDLDNITLNYLNRQQKQDLTLQINASGSTRDENSPTTITADGSLNDLPIHAEAQLASLLVISEGVDNLSIDASVQAGGTVASVQGVIGDPAELKDLDITFSVVAPNVQDLEVLANVPLPILPPFDFSGGLHRDGDDIILRRFSGTLGDSDMQGDIRADLTTSPPTLYANIISEQFDLDDLAGILGSAPDPDETASTEQLPKQTAQSKLLPTTKLNLKPMMQAFNGAIRFRAQQVKSDTYPVDSIAARLEIDGNNLTISPIRIGVGGGEISGSVDLDTAQSPTAGTVDLRIKQVDLQRVMIALGIDDDSFGQIGGRAKYWISGDSVANFAADADGGLYLLMTQGKLDALLVELSAFDLIESTLLLLDPGKTLTNISCAYLDLHTAAGLSDISTFVLDTKDTLFLAEGTIDFNTESFDVTIEPHPKDSSLINLSTSVTLSGTVGDISITPGAELPLRAVAAATLAAVATPIAALLPLLDTSQATNSPYCNGLIGSLDQAR